MTPFTMVLVPRLALSWHAGSQRQGRRRTDIRCFAGGAHVKFVIPYHCRWGQHLCLVGSIEKLGQWDVARGLEMTWSDGDVWRAEVDIPQSAPTAAEAEFEYKYVVRNGDRETASAWTPGQNYILKLPAGLEEASSGGGIRLYVRDTWDGTNRKVKVHRPGTPHEDMEDLDQHTDMAGNASAAVAPPPPAKPQPAVAAAVAAPPSPPSPLAPAPEFAAPPLPPPTTAPPPPPPPPPAPRAPSPARAAAASSARTTSPQPRASRTQAAEADAGTKRRGRRRTKAPQPAPALEPTTSSQPAVPDPVEAEDVVLAAITRESERAMHQLDAAISSSWELLEGVEVDPADPRLLAADRRLAAASQRAQAMYKALDAAAAQRLLGGDSSSNRADG